MTRKLLCGLGVLFTALMLASACTAVRLIQSTKIIKPEIKYDRYEVGNPTQKKTPVYLKFSAHNPNAIGLTNVFVSYELYAEKKRFLKGDNVALTLAPKGDTVIVVPAEIIYEDVVKVLGPLAETILRGKDTFPVEVAVKVFGTPTVYNEVEAGALFAFDFATTRSVEVPIPQDKIEHAKDKALEELKKLKKLF